MAVFRHRKIAAPSVQRIGPFLQWADEALMNMWRDWHMQATKEGGPCG
jgi:hypothetical protein